MKISTSITATLLTCLALAGCARREDDADMTTSTDASAAQADPQASQQPADVPPPPETASVSVQVKLAADAESALKATGETIAVEVVFAGDPSPGSSISTNELGLVELGKSTKELSGSGSLEFPEDLINQSKLGQIVGQPHVIINTHSSKKPNLLNCTFYWETLSTAGQAPIQIDCALAQ